MLFTWSCQCKNLLILIPRYYTEFDGHSLFPVSLILILSDSTFLRDLKITNWVFSILSEIFLLSTNYSTVLYHGWLAYLEFSLTYLYERDLYHQQSDVFCSIELLYEDQ